MEFYQGEEKNLVRWIVKWVVDIIVVISLAFFLVFAFGTQIKVTGNSMAPQLTSDQVILMNRLTYDFMKPKRFDVVVFDKGDGNSNIKRIVGMPGETVQIQNGRIYIDDKLLDAPDELTVVSLAGLAESKIYLSRDEYFLLGDNRDSSEDSRFANVGNVSREQILGKVWLRLLPLEDFGFIN